MFWSNQKKAVIDGFFFAFYLILIRFVQQKALITVYVSRCNFLILVLLWRLTTNNPLNRGFFFA